MNEINIRRYNGILENVFMELNSIIKCWILEVLGLIIISIINIIYLPILLNKIITILLLNNEKIFKILIFLTIILKLIYIIIFGLNLTSIFLIISSYNQIYFIYKKIKLKI